MAFANKIIFNQKTGQLIKFIQTSNDTEGKLLEMNVTFPPQLLPPPMHYHPNQTENFRIIFGKLSVHINGKTLTLQQGDTLQIPPNMSHAMWNSSENKTIVNWQIRPALQTEYLLETLTGLANDNKTNCQGVPSILQKISTAQKYNDSLRLSKPSYLIQKIIFAILTPVAFISGYQPDDEKYFK